MSRLFPINIGFVVLVEPVNTDDELHQQLQRLESLRVLANSFNAKMTVLLSGPFADRAMAAGEQDVFTSLIYQGHEIGTYVVPYCRVSSNVWSNFSSRLLTFPATTPFDEGLIRRVWAENTAVVDTLVGGSNNTSVHSLVFTIPLEESLLTSNHFTTAFSTRINKGLEYIGHPIEHPFRPELSPLKGFELKEDTTTQFLFVDGFVGIADHKDPLSCPDLRPNTISRSFEERYREWIAIEDNRVWTFVFATYLSRNEVSDEIKQVLTTVSGFANKSTLASELIARFSTLKEIYQNFINWESINPPNTSSFSFAHVQSDLAIPPKFLPTDSVPAYIPSVGLRRLFSNLHKPSSASSTNKYPGVVILSGDGAIVPGFSPNEIAALGFVVVHYDRAGKGNSTGENDYGGLNDQEDLKTVVQYLRSQSFVDVDNIGIIALGYGLVIAAGALDRYSLNIKYLVDWEGPSNRSNISEFDKTEDFSGFSLADDLFWEPREPFRTIQSFAGRYLRIQGAVDHFQGTNMSHAIEMIESSTGPSYGGSGNAELTVLNGNPVNLIYDPSRSDSSINPSLWLHGSSILRIASDNAGKILNYFKFISKYSKLNITLAVTIPRDDMLVTDEDTFRNTADRLRKLASAFERADAKLSILTENTFIEGSRAFDDPILSEMVTRGHSVGSLIDIPLDKLTQNQKKQYVINSKTNLDTAIGSANNVSAMGALSLEDHNFLHQIGYNGIIGPLVEQPHHIPKAARVRLLSHSLTRKDTEFIISDDPLGTLFYLPGDLSKISLPDEINIANTERATDSIVISRNLIDSVRSNSWYIFVSIFDFIDEDTEIAILEQWATQEVGFLASQGDIRWANLNEMIAEAHSLLNRERLNQPSTPQDLKAEPGDGIVSLSWERSNGDRLAGYIVLRQGCFGANYNVVGNVPDRDPSLCDAFQDNRIRFTDSKVENGKEYCYIVRAYTSDTPPLFSSLSNEVCITPHDSAPPPAPKIIDFTEGNRSVALAWNRVAAADNRFYRIYRHALDPENPIDLSTLIDICKLRENFQLAAQVDANTLQIIDTGLENGQTYIYIVSSVDSAGNESFDINNAIRATPFDNIASLPLWIATNLGLTKTEDRGDSFNTVNPCGDDFDVTGSIITFQSPTNNSFVSHPVRVLLAVDDPKGIQKVQVSLGDDKTPITCTRTTGNLFEGELDASAFAEGTTLSIFATATNSIGIITRSSIAVQVKDIEGPQIRIINPLNGDSATTSFTVQIQAIDPSGIDQVSVSVNNSTFTRAKQIGEFWFLTVDTRDMNGDISIRAASTDILGRQTITDPVVINVDNTADTTGPQITVISPPFGGELSGNVVISAEAVDPSGVGIMEVSFNGGEFQAMSFSQLQSNRLMLANARYPSWSPDGTKLAFINSIDGKLYEAGIDSNGQAGPPRLIWDVAQVPGRSVSEAVRNGSFETVDEFGRPTEWELGSDSDAPFIVFDIGQAPQDIVDIYIGDSNPRKRPVGMPFKLPLRIDDPLTAGPPFISVGSEAGIFIWREADTWHIAVTSDGIRRRVKGSISTSHPITDLDVSNIAASTITQGVQEISFEFDATSSILERISFKTPSTIPANPDFARITGTAIDGLNAIEIER